MATVGVRELRQNLSVYLRRVKAGESLEVTEHNQPVARLVPLPKPEMSMRDRLIAEGRLIPGKGNLAAFLDKHPPLKPPPNWKPLSETIIEMRDEERY
ncbi:MAG TPA: type II toxin-antitoxin system prevent-host-death family antitoxin [Chloroflexota bacterium]|nr:type II toxin-antitoxin system prevent-host-death family antitoxin [Chloroflexota bacterium]